MQKLKFQYLQSENIHPNDGIRERYPHLRNVYHKKFSTLQERSFYFLHLLEYKNYPLKLSVARGTGLPDERVDLPAYVYKVAKSWKHNSRRRKQYYRKQRQNKSKII